MKKNNEKIRHDKANSKKSCSNRQIGQLRKEGKHFGGNGGDGGGDGGDDGDDDGGGAADNDDGGGSAV